MAGVRRRLVQLRKAAVLLTRPAWRRGLMRGVAATIEHRPLERLIRPRTVIDIGANKGQFTLFTLGLWPDCYIHAFEPLSGPAARFRAVTGVYPNVRLFEAAIGPDSGEADIHLSAREDSSSLLPMGERMIEIFPEARGTGSTRRIHVARLSDFLRAEDIVRPALLKLDVQGFELEALKGCESLLPAVDYVYAECSYMELYRGQALSQDIEAFLARRGFAAIGVFNTVEDGARGPVQADALFMRRSSDDGAGSGCGGRK